MIARLSGRLLSRDAEALVVDVHGVGFRVAVSRLTAEVLPATGETIQLEVHTHVREDAIQLFGFVDAGERQAFEALIGMSGMGPKAAMGVLSGIDARELAQAVDGGDLARLCLIPGIGKKKAERMVLELKERLSSLARTAGGEPAAAAWDDLRSALTNLGFKAGEVDRALAELRREAAAEATLDALLPQALQILRS